jgi:hypothetical protein
MTAETISALKTNVKIAYNIGNYKEPNQKKYSLLALVKTNRK